ncbi:glycosyltransferase family 4 protein [Alienimonas chondri]|uniref:D-inositol-3-phosphate glycosyltransferase n=1 Tax=Alienimonas chondri TaxID=2681879 RepID=A0ABX1VGK1_9PLAN|nr:glycosyltransferase family 4 protein [Alienimonas chondri]NNJ27220.1 D-inositol-3-phosphate glycosyltransferase [Alienimonas chondri]
MHVVHFITRLILGGAQENTLFTCEGQHAAGDRVTLVTGPGLGREGSLMDRAREAGFEVVELPELVRNLRPRADYRAMRAFERLLVGLKPDLVHTHSGKAGILGRAAAAKAGVPAIHTVHGPSFHPFQNPVSRAAFRAAERWAGPKTAHFISVADAMTDQYVAAGIAPRERFTTIRSGMLVEPFLDPPAGRAAVRERGREELGFAPTDVVAAKVARLSDLKGQRFLVDAAEALKDRSPQLKYLLIGDGPLREGLERRIAAAGLTDRFVFTGLVPSERIPDLLHASDLVVHTSLREGLPRVLPQGLIAGKPVVAFDADGAREVCLTGQTGVLVPPKDVPALAEALATLAADPALRERLGAEGRRRFTDPFRHTTMVRQIRALSADVVAGKRGTAVGTGDFPPLPGN